ncbi:MAG: hypothetical protein M1817_002484 [Caeruleum heppii]|nr:MAG: hypothetical protein M1817_002484 [Caeruleum heppii]
MVSSAWGLGLLLVIAATTTALPRAPSVASPPSESASAAATSPTSEDATTFAQLLQSGYFLADLSVTSLPSRSTSGDLPAVETVYRGMDTSLLRGSRCGLCPNTTTPNVAAFDQTLYEALMNGSPSGMLMPEGPNGRQVQPDVGGSVAYTEQACALFEAVQQAHGYPQMGYLITRDVATPIFISVQRLRPETAKSAEVWKPMYASCSWALSTLAESCQCPLPDGRSPDTIFSSGGSTVLRPTRFVRDTDPNAIPAPNGPALRLSIQTGYDASAFRCDHQYCLHIQ